jgi:uncharacterized LabA/DUF88 family protein
MGCGAPSGALAFWGAKKEMRTSIYVDGFNLYHGALKGTPHKWLDLKKMCSMMLAPHNTITCVKYFTANVSPTPNDPLKPINQQLYIRALMETNPELEVIRGQFTSHVVKRKLSPPLGAVKYANVIERTEKGSDVNLAAHLLNDAWRDAYDCAIVVSGDSDLAESIRLVREYHDKKVVGVYSTSKRSMSKKLTDAATFVRSITTSVLVASQLPNKIPNTTVVKPSDW